MAVIGLETMGQPNESPARLSSVTLIERAADHGAPADRSAGLAFRRAGLGFHCGSLTFRCGSLTFRWAGLASHWAGSGQ